MIRLLLVLLLLAAPAFARDSPIIDLAAEEAAGGHTLSRHVGRTEAQLQDRLRREPRIPAAGSFPDRATAEFTASAALDRNREAVARWIAEALPGGTRSFNYTAPREVGAGVLRDRDGLVPMRRVRLVLRKGDTPRGWFILTIYPVP